MPKAKLIQLTEPVKNYLKMQVAQSGTQPVALESERTLCPRFGISRPTLHRAVEELMADGWFLKLPGRRGIFSNPERFMPGMRNIGLLNGDCYSSSFICAPAIYSFVREFSDMRTYINFTRLYSTSLEERLQEIDSLHFAGFLFFINHETVPLIRALIEKGVPVVGMVYYNISDFGLPAANFEPFDYRKSLENRLAFIRKNGYRKIVMMSEHIEYYTEFQRLSGNLLEKENFILGIDDIPSRLPGILSGYKPDLLISDGSFRRYRFLFDVLENHSGKIPELLLYPQLNDILEENVLRKFKIHFMNDTRIFEIEGKNAAMKLKKLMDNT